MTRVLSFLLIAALWLTGVPTLAAEDDSVRLGIEAVDSERPYFELKLEPGESEDLTVRFVNHGESGAGVEVYRSDVTTISGGGMGLQSKDGARTGATEWLDFQEETMDLLPGERVEQTFTVSVPEDVEPGEYITSIAMQNADPVAVGSEDGSGQFTQTLRYGVAVNIDVPGPREPAMEIGDVSHQSSGGRSAIHVGITNSGNTHLEPTGAFSLYSDDGDLVGDRAVSMDTVYAGTETRLEAVLNETLEPGDYAASLILEDHETGLAESVDDVPVTVAGTEAGSETDDDRGQDAGAGGTISFGSGPDSQGSSAGVWLPGLLLPVVGLVVISGVYLYWRRNTQPAKEQSRFITAPAPREETPPRKRPKIRQLRPAERTS